MPSLSYVVNTDARFGADAPRVRPIPTGTIVRGRIWREGTVLKARAVIVAAGQPATVECQVDLKKVYKWLVDNGHVQVTQGDSVNGFPGSVFKAVGKIVKKVGHAVLNNKLMDGIKAVVKSKYTAAALGVAAIAFPPVGVPAAAAFAASNVALSAIDKYKQVQKAAASAIAKGKGYLVQAKKAEILATKAASDKAREALRGIAEKARQGDPEAKQGARIIALTVAHRARTVPLRSAPPKKPSSLPPAGNLPAAPQPAPYSGILVTDTGHLLPGAWASHVLTAMKQGLPGPQAVKVGKAWGARVGAVKLSARPYGPLMASFGPRPAPRAAPRAAPRPAPVTMRAPPVRSAPVQLRVAPKKTADQSALIRQGINPDTGLVIPPRQPITRPAPVQLRVAPKKTVEQQTLIKQGINPDTMQPLHPPVPAEPPAYDPNYAQGGGGGGGGLSADTSDGSDGGGGDDGGYEDPGAGDAGGYDEAPPDDGGGEEEAPPDDGGDEEAPPAAAQAPHHRRHHMRQQAPPVEQYEEEEPAEEEEETPGEGYYAPSDDDGYEPEGMGEESYGDEQGIDAALFEEDYDTDISGAGSGRRYYRHPGRRSRIGCCL